MLSIDLLNGVNFIYPAVPRVNVRFISELNKWLPQEPPWNAMGWIPVGLFPYMSAIGLFMPTDMLFSLVFFFFARKLTQLLMAAWGYEQGLFGGSGLTPSPPYFSEQTWGAFLGLFVGSMWSARGYLRRLWQHICQGTSFSDDELAPRAAATGLVISLMALCTVGAALGLSAVLVLVFSAFRLKPLEEAIAGSRAAPHLLAAAQVMVYACPRSLRDDFAETYDRIRELWRKRAPATTLPAASA
jgi:hypothetical protein